MCSSLKVFVVNGSGGFAVLMLGIRLAVGVFFTLSGYHKLTNVKRRALLVETLKDCRIPFVSVMQWFVPSVELVGGLAVAAGALTPFAAFGLALICLVATCTDGARRVKSQAAVDVADLVDDILYLPEVTYTLLLPIFIVGGAGPFSVDALLSGLF
jgi:putative oxidoreductase